jgi:hypothetical protein
MKCSVNVPNFGEFASPEAFAEVARHVEAAGWDALLVWDHVVGERSERWEIAPVLRRVDAGPPRV